MYISVMQVMLLCMLQMINMCMRELDSWRDLDSCDDVQSLGDHLECW